MPRRAVDSVLVEPPRKKSRVVPVPEPRSLDASFFDDEALPPGIVLTDVSLKKWRIGQPIGRGSFGRIYLASDNTASEVTRSEARYVVKIEPHSNGPLFVEIHCLIRIAKTEQIKSWRVNNKQKRLGMPLYIASGSFTDTATGTRYRFLVLPRYEIDLQKVIARRGRILDLKNVLVLAIQILDVLEYLHSQGYTHSDIKSSNLMVGFDGAKFGKMPPPMVKSMSFQKPSKKVPVFSGKYSKDKLANKSRSSYYNDEDFVFKDKSSSGESTVDDTFASNEKKLKSVKKKLRRILSDRDNRILHRHHAFNLRQLPGHVNYEDVNSSVCSDQSYQRLLDDTEYVQAPSYSSDEGFHEANAEYPKTKAKSKTESFSLSPDEDNTFEEAIVTQTSGQIYLLDYGLATKFLNADGNHKEFAMDARKAHDGTLEYSSRDSHIGAHSRRSDLETLGFNLLDWMTGTLPWKTTEMLAEPDLVHALKKNYMQDVKTLLKTCFKTEFYPHFIEKYLQYVTSLDFNEKPDYNMCRNIFRNEFFKNFGVDKETVVSLNETPMSPMNRKKLFYSKRFGKNVMKNTSQSFVARNGVKKIYERENISSLENDLKMELLKKTLNSSSEARKPCSSRNFFISDSDLVARLKQSLLPFDNLGKKLSPKNLRSKKRKVLKKKGRKTHRSSSIGKFGNFLGSGRQFTWAEILAGNPEDIIRKEKASADTEDDDTNKYRIRKISNASDTLPVDNAQSPLLQKDYLQGLNPTYAMKDVHTNFRKKASGKTLKDLSDDDDNHPEGYTPAMVLVFRAKQKREAKEKIQELQEKQKRSAPKILHRVHSTRYRCNRTALNRQSKSQLNTSFSSHAVSKKKPVVKVEKLVLKTTTGTNKKVVDNKQNSPAKKTQPAKDKKESKAKSVKQTNIVGKISKHIAIPEIEKGKRVKKNGNVEKKSPSTMPKSSKSRTSRKSKRVSIETEKKKVSNTSRREEVITKKAGITQKSTKPDPPLRSPTKTKRKSLTLVLNRRSMRSSRRKIK